MLDKARDEKIEIATISFAHKNGEMIQRLIKRGAAFGNGKYREVRRMDDDIKAVARVRAEELGTPVKAFITFCTQEGYERCEKHLFTGLGEEAKAKYGIDIFGIPSKRIAAAPEPTNIIWENQAVPLAT